jgi:hypothetical protein
MIEKQTLNQTVISLSSQSLTEYSLLLYVRTGVVLVPIVLVYQICGFFQWIEINIFQVLARLHFHRFMFTDHCF